MNRVVYISKGGNTKKLADTTMKRIYGEQP